MFELLLIIIFFIVFFIFIKKSQNEVSNVPSDVDGHRYLVRNLEDKDKAANMLAKIRKNMMILKDHLVENKDTKYKDMKPYIEQLDRNLKNVVINESGENSSYTSYSVNKGKEIVFCLRSKRNNKLHDLNLVMYVALHELGHVGCPEYGHTDLFKQIFAFFTEVAMEIGLYEKIYFNIDPAEYCGITITESIV